MNIRYYLKIGLLLSIPLGAMLVLFLKADSWQTFLLYFVIGSVVFGIGRVFDFACTCVIKLFNKMKGFGSKGAE